MADQTTERPGMRLVVSSERLERVRRFMLALPPAGTKVSAAEGASWVAFLEATLVPEWEPEPLRELGTRLDKALRGARWIVGRAVDDAVPAELPGPSSWSLARQGVPGDC